jgi:hypothetical protein
MNDEQTTEQQEQPRKASDILLSIESKMNSLIKAMSVYDLNVKLILSRVNVVYAYIEQLKAEAELPPDQDAPIAVLAEAAIQLSTEPSKDRRMGRVGVPVQIPQVQQERPIPQTQQPVQVPQSDKKANTPTSPDRKVPVVQQLKYNNGGDVFMAEVSIANQDNELVHKTKTNAIGKWQAHLKPGKYYVSVVKTDTTTKKKIEALQELIIPNSNDTVNLPPAIIKRD